MSRRAQIVLESSARTLALAVLALVFSPAGALAQSVAPLTGAGRPGAIPGQYIVVMKNAASDASKERTKRTARARGGRVNREYGTALKGYAAALPAAALAEVRSDPDVAYVEADAVVSATATQLGAPWGLDRIDQSSLPLSGSYSYTATGAGVTAYIIDSGFRFGHSQFAGRAVSGYDAVDGGFADDCDGHGTHVAGTVGGSTYGVAKQVSLVAVRVLDCAGSGTNSGVIAGIDWVTGDHASGRPAVANMSLGGTASRAVDAAVQRSIADGVTYAVSAGNDNKDACLDSPARVADALTVASTNSADARSSFSNFGACVDLFAPGSSIMSSWYTSDTATNTISGTSMAAPHVAGVAALYLQDNPAAMPAAVANAVRAGATAGKVTGPGTGSPDRLLQTITGQAADAVAPETSIGSGPSAFTRSASPSFALSSSEAASTFECRLDAPGLSAAAYAPCSSPKGYASLADGTYMFWVRATDVAGNTDASPATHAFIVDTAAPQTAIDEGPSGTISSGSGDFGLWSSEAASTFECSLDGPGSAVGSYTPCSSPQSYSSLADGSYTFSVRATDGAGNTDATPATRAFTVGTTQPVVSAPPATAPPLAPLPSPPPAPLPPRPPAPPAPLPASAVAMIDDTAPAAALSASRSQKVGKTLRVSVSCPNEACRADAGGTVRVPKIGAASARLFKLAKVTTAIAPGERGSLRPRLSYAARVAIGRALRRGRRVTASLKVTLADAAGNKKTLVRQVRLRR